MSTSVTIDKAGRIVVPKDLRESLHLTPGTVLRVECTGERLTLTPASREAQLVIENGTPLIYPADGTEAPILTSEMVRESQQQTELERVRRTMGLNRDGDRD
jgi:AbrB family looped-hinge helix DNA binding protein